ncbi:DUF349 domain-containing protein [Marinobacterium lutimaris]|uniref:DUF349 domain-containing protein n=1 Tax=Marinobacterium lutimaris TaxID=568106 RepID=A0A1H6CDA1_9GAMM|nr:DUF349 domain-containing protein [Marinobacterium lutimaris]SEG70346.1 protein of unknown function [Marinobacterium lutimaris]
MFANLFKPKWRHPSPDVRARAVNRLDSDRPAHSDILRSLLLDDRSSEVRRAAIERVTDTALLIQALTAEQDAEIRHLAANAIAAQLSSRSMNEQLEWALKLPTDSTRVELVLADISSTLRSHIIDLVEEQQFLILIALKGPTAQTRREAALRVSGPEHLETLARDSRGSDKAVHRIARDAIQALREQEKEQAQIAIRREELLASLDTLVNGQDQQLFQARFDVLIRDWSQLPEASQQQNDHYLVLKAQAEQVIAEQAARKAAAEAAEQARILHAEQAQALDTELAALCLRSADATALLPELNELLQRAEQYRNEGDVETQLAERVATAAKLLEAISQLAELEPHIQQQLETPADGNGTDIALAGYLSRIDWPTSCPQPALLNRAQQILNEARQAKREQKEQISELCTRLEKTLDQLEQAIEQGEIRNALKQRERAEQQAQAVSTQLPDALEQRLKVLTAQLQEIKDWQGFAVNGKKEALCEQMEALIGSALEPQPLADRIRALQKEWKALDSNSAVHSQKLWQRFRTAAETAYAPCESHFASQKEKRLQNLTQREEICRQLETLFESVNWDEAEWPAIERICHTAKREWKQFSPVDRAPGKVLQQRFNQLIRELDNRLRTWHQQCANTKQSLVDSAAALTEWEDVSAAAAEAKALQQQWKQTGPAFRTEERALWQAFREHCDAIFARLKSTGSSGDPISVEQTTPPLKAEAMSRLESCAELLDKAEKAILDGNSGIVDKLLSAISDSLSQVPEQWKLAMSQRVDAVASLLSSPDALEARLADSESELRELCIRLEILLSQPSPDEDQAQRMEYQMLRLQQAIDEQSRNPSSADVTELELLWHCVAFNRVFPQLSRRFNQLKQRTV